MFPIRGYFPFLFCFVNLSQGLTLSIYNPGCGTQQSFCLSLQVLRVEAWAPFWTVCQILQLLTYVFRKVRVVIECHLLGSWTHPSTLLSTMLGGSGGPSLGIPVWCVSDGAARKWWHLAASPAVTQWHLAQHPPSLSLRSRKHFPRFPWWLLLHYRFKGICSPVSFLLNFGISS